MRVYLIGITGCGKSTLGIAIAQKLGYKFVDLDDYIIEQQGKSIEQIFENDGEIFFRKLEEKALLELNDDYLVVSTGGGAPCFFNNMQYMMAQGKTVWLNPDAEVVADRLFASPNSQNRPLLKNRTKADVLEFVISKTKERQKFYSQAEVIITHNNITPEMILNALS